MSPTTHNRPDISPELVLVDPELRRVAQLLLPEPGALAAAARAEASARRAEVLLQPVRTARPRRGAWVRRGVAGSIAGTAAALVAWATAVSPAGQRPTLLAPGPASAPSSAVRPESDARRALSLPSQQPAVGPKRVVRQAPPRKVTRPKARPVRGLVAPPKTAPSREPVASPKTAPSPKAAPAPRAPRVTKVSRQRPTLSWKAVRGASYYNVIVWQRGERVLDLWPSANKAILPRTWTFEGKRRTLSPGRYFWFVYPGFGPKADASYGDAVRTGILVVDRK